MILRIKAACFIGSELPYKCIVDDIPTARIGRFDIDGDVGARNPDGVWPVVRNEHCLGLKVTNL